MSSISTKDRIRTGRSNVYSFKFGGSAALLALRHRHSHTLVSEDRGGLRANAAALWALISVVVASQAVVIQWSQLSIVTSPKFLINIYICCVLTTIGIFFTFCVFRPRLALITSSLAQLVTASVALCLLTYSLTALAGSTPLRDDVLALIDGRLGFHWIDVLRWSNAHPELANLSGDAYGSIAKQAIVAIIALGLRRDYRKLQGSVYAYVIALTATSVVSFFVPALGAYAFFGVHADSHQHIALRTADLPVEEIRNLRSHLLTSFDLETAKGIISFPSFHAALGVLFMWCFWSIPGLRWAAVALNSAMIISTPLHGSHYLIDVLGGLVIGFVATRSAARLHDVVSLRWGSTFGGRASTVTRRESPLVPAAPGRPVIEAGPLGVALQLPD